MKILITRPYPAALQTQRQLEEKGHSCLCLPLMETDFHPPQHLDIPSTVRATLITSPRALQAFDGHKELPRLRDIPVFCVGDATAAAARMAGFSIVYSAGSTARSLSARIPTFLKDVYAHIPEDVCFFYPCGTHRSSLIETRIRRRKQGLIVCPVYTMHALKKFPEDILRAFRAESIDAVLLFSAQTAEVFCRLMTQEHLGAQLLTLRIYALSQKTALPVIRALKKNRKKFSEKKSFLYIAQKPESDSLLSLL